MKSGENRIRQVVVGYPNRNSNMRITPNRRISVNIRSRIGFPWAFMGALTLTGLGLYAALTGRTMLSLAVTMVSMFLLGWTVCGIAHSVREVKRLRAERRRLDTQAAPRGWTQVDV